MAGKYINANEKNYSILYSVALKDSSLHLYRERFNTQDEIVFKKKPKKKNHKYL